MLMSTAQAAKKLKCTAPHVANLCRRGQIGIRIGRDWFVNEEDVSWYKKNRSFAGKPVFGRPGWKIRKRTKADYGQ